MIEITKKERMTGILLICIGLILVLIGVHLTYTLNNRDYMFISMLGFMPFILFGFVIGFAQRGG